MIHEEISGTIIGAAMEVLNELKPGLDDPAPAGLTNALWSLNSRIAGTPSPSKDRFRFFIEAN
jgi:hypothetical protein